MDVLLDDVDLSLGCCSLALIRTLRCRSCAVSDNVCAACVGRRSVARQSNAGTVRLYNGGMSCAVGTPKADDGANAVIMAAMITATIFFSLTAFTVQSKIDFSFLGAGLFVCLMVLMLFGFGMMIFGASASMYYGYCVAGAVLFSLYIIFGIHAQLPCPTNSPCSRHTSARCAGLCASDSEHTPCHVLAGALLTCCLRAAALRHVWTREHARQRR